MKWSIHPGSALLTTYYETWQSANRDLCGCHPMLDLKFLVPLLECFGNSGVRAAICNDGNSVIGAAILTPTGPGVWELFLPPQACVGPLILDGKLNNQLACLDELMRALPGSTWLLGLLMLDPLFFNLSELERCTKTERLTHFNTTSISIDRPFETFWATRPKEVRRTISRSTKKTHRSELQVQLKQSRSPGKMSSDVAMHGDLESAGWKGRHATAIHRDNIQGSFYTKVLENFAQEGGARVFQLYFNDILVASLLGVQQNGMLVILKTAYDESMREYAPGRLIDYFMLEAIFNEKEINRLEFYTNASSEDAKWCTDRRSIYHANYYSCRWLKSMVTGIRQLRDRVSKLPMTSNQSDRISSKERSTRRP